MAKVLLIEDYPGLQRVYSKILSVAGHDVYNAWDGKEGLEVAQKCEADLLLVDLLMPVMGGIEFLEKYELKKRPNVKAIVLTNIYDEDMLKKAKKLGVSDYMIKADIHPDGIIKKIDEILATA